VPSSTPIPDATPVFADAERPHYFDDGFSLIPEPAAEKGDDVPVLLTKPQSELESGSTAAYGALEIVDDDILLGDASAIATRKTELGVWAVGFDAQVRKAWVYPPELRALGINGVVTLEFTVLPSGRVIDIHAQSSSMEELIIPSAAAIPEQAEPLPKDKAFRKGIHFSYTFRYGETP
jgi:TonB family protein